MKRVRKHIPLRELLATVLSQLLPREERDALRARKASADEVIRQFTPDHAVLHCHNGADRWWNLTMQRRGPELRVKDANDTRVAAKVRRIEHRWNEFARTVLAIRKPPKRKSRWPKRRLRT